MKTSLNLSVCPLLLSLLAGCASKEPPVIALDEPVEAQRLPEPPRPIPFHVERPFYFLIEERTTGVPLFMGRVVDPTEA